MPNTTLLYTVDPFLRGGPDNPADITQTLDHEIRGLAKLTKAYCDKPRIVAILSAFLRQIQQVENAMFQLVSKINIDGGDGAVLDLIGSLIGAPRSGATDQEYRIVLRGVVAANKSDGKSGAVLKVLTLLLAGAREQPAVIKWEDLYPAGFKLSILSDTTGTPIPRLVELIERAKAGGVSLSLEHSLNPSSEVFSFSDFESGIHESPQGFNSGALLNLVQ